jgi:hypothetical protein
MWLEDEKVFEYNNNQIVSDFIGPDFFEDGSELIYLPLNGDLSAYNGDGVYSSKTAEFIETSAGVMYRFRRDRYLRLYGNYMKEPTLSISLKLIILDGHYNYNTIWDDGTSNDAEFWLPSSGYLWIRPKDGSAKDTGKYLNVGQLYDIAVVYGASKTKVYVDGFLVNEFNNAGTLHTRDIFFGAYANNKFGGGMRDIRVFNRELTHAEVNLLAGNISQTGQTIPKVVSETIEIIDHNQKRIRYNLCGDNSGRVFPPKTISYGAEKTNIVIVTVPPRPIEETHGEENISYILVTGMVQNGGVDDVEIQEVVVPVIM